MSDFCSLSYRLTFFNMEALTRVKTGVTLCSHVFIFHASQPAQVTFLAFRLFMLLGLNCEIVIKVGASKSLLCTWLIYFLVSSVAV